MSLIYLPPWHAPNPAAASSLDDSNFTASIRRLHISSRRPFAPHATTVSFPCSQPLCHQSPAAAIAVLFAPNPTPASITVPTPFSTKYRHRTANAAKRSPRPSPANAIHVARHTPGTRHFIRTRAGIPRAPLYTAQRTTAAPNTQKAGEEDPLRLLLTGDVVPNYFTGSSCTVK